MSSDGISPLREKHMSVCTGGIMIVQAFILLLGMEAFLFAGKFALYIGHHINLFNLKTVKLK